MSFCYVSKLRQTKIGINYLIIGLVFALVSHKLIDFILIFSYRICKGLVHKSFQFIQINKK